MAAAVRSRNYGRSSSAKGDNFSTSSSKYSGFHPNTELSGGSWNSVRWVRPTPGSSSRHANLMAQFKSTGEKMASYTTANRPNARTGRKDSNHSETSNEPSWQSIQLNSVSRPIYKAGNYYSSNQSANVSRQNNRRSATPLRPVREDQPRRDSSAPSSSRRGSINALQENSSVLQDAVSALRATADSLTSGNFNKQPDGGFSRSDSRTSLARDTDLGYFTRTRGSSATRYPTPTSLAVFSKSWPPSPSTNESNTRCGSLYESRRNSACVSEYGSTYFLSGMKRDSLSGTGSNSYALYSGGRQTPSAVRRDSLSYTGISSAGYNGGRQTPSGTRRDSFSKGNTSVGLQHSYRRHSLLSAGSKWGFGQENYRRSAEPLMNSNLSTYSLRPTGISNYLSPKRNSVTGETASELLSQYRSKSDSIVGSNVPFTTSQTTANSTLADNTSASTDKTWSIAPRKFLTKRKDESEGYDSSSSDKTKDLNPLKKVKTYRKRNSGGGSGKKCSKAMNASTTTESSSSGIKSMKDITQSSSEEEMSKKGSFEARMRHRRRRLQKSKAFVQNESSGGLCGSDTKIAHFSIEKVYLNQVLQSQENLRPKEIMTTSAPAAFSMQQSFEPDDILPTSELSKAVIALESTDMNYAETCKTVIPDVVPSEQKNSFEMDVSESSDTLVPEAPSETVPNNEHSSMRPFCDMKVEDVFGAPVERTIDFSGLEEFSFDDGLRTRNNGIIVKQKESACEREATAAAEPIIVEEEKDESEKQPAPNADSQELIKAFETQQNKIPIENSNFGSAQQKTERKDDRSGLEGEEAAVVSEKIAGSFSHQESSQPRTETPRFAGAKRIVVLHSGPNETTVREKSSLLTDSVIDVEEDKTPDKHPTERIGLGSAKSLPEQNQIWTKPAKRPRADRRPAGSNVEEEERTVAASSEDFADRRNFIPAPRIGERTLHVLPPTDQEVIDLLTLGEELNNSRHTKGQSGTDSESGFRTPEVEDLPAPSKPIFLSNFLSKADENISGSGNTTPTPNKRGSLESVASFMTANSGTSSMKDLTFVLTARPQPFRSSSENFGKQRYGHVEPSAAPLVEHSSLIQNKQMFQGSLPALQRTASTTSNDSWVSAASGKSSSLEAAAKKVDEMLRLARRKHQENRTRFRDAMDHLDHIYEEIKKEAEDVRISPEKKPRFGHRVEKENDHNFERPVHMFTPSSKALPVPEIVAYENYQPMLNGVPVGNEKLNFTKKWLEDDLRSLTTDPDPRPDLLQFGPIEVDQRSVGSASAEIAAITGKEILAALKIPDLVPQKHQAVIKPSPVRYASFQDVSLPLPPQRKDSLSSVDSARIKVGRFLDKHADERLLDVKANQGHVKRKANFFGKLSDNDSDRGQGSPSAGFERKPPHTVYLHQIHQSKQRSFDTAQKQPEIPNISDDDVGLNAQQRKYMHSYAESTRSLPIIGTTARHPEWRKTKQANNDYSFVESTPQKPRRIIPRQPADQIISSSSNTLTEPEPLRNTKPFPNFNTYEPKNRYQRNKRNLGSEALQTVDHLVAELELNTEEQELSPRSFPTAGIAKYGVDFSALPEDTVEPRAANLFIPEPTRLLGKKPEPKLPKRVNLYEDFNEAQKVLFDVTSSNFGQSHTDRTKYLKKPLSDNTDGFQTINKEGRQRDNPSDDVKNGFRSTFVTINEEKLGESKVVTMKSMFEPLVQEKEKSPPKLPVVTSQPPGKGTVHAPVPFRPTESRDASGRLMETSLTGSYELYGRQNVAEHNQKLSRNSSKSSSKRAFQQIQSKSATEMLPIPAMVPMVPSTLQPDKPQTFAPFELTHVNRPTNISHRRTASSNNPDDDYDNVILPSVKSPPTDTVVARNPASSLRHPGAIKINSMKLGDDDEPRIVRMESSSSKNPIKNLLRRLKSQPGTSSEAPRQPSTLSLNEPLGPPVQMTYNLHKSSSVGEAWSESSSLSQFSENPLPTSRDNMKAIVKVPKGKAGRKFWTPWKK